MCVARDTSYSPWFLEIDVKTKYVLCQKKGFMIYIKNYIGLPFNIFPTQQLADCAWQMRMTVLQTNKWQSHRAMSTVITAINRHNLDLKQP